MRGFTDALRMELEMEDAPVGVTCVFPGGIKTSIAHNSRGNASLQKIGLDAENSREKFNESFITEPDKAAGTILRAVEKNKRHALVGPDAHVIDTLARLLPGAYQPLVKRLALKSLG